MRFPLRSAAALSLLAVVAAACTFDDPNDSFAQITFQHLPDIGLDVGNIEVEQAYMPPAQAPNVDHRFPVQPRDAAARWADDRLVARGDRLTFRYTVRQASAVESELPRTTGVRGLLTTDQSERYEVHVVIEMQILDGRQQEGSARAEVRRSTTVPEGISLRERERVWYRLTEETMNDLDRQLEQTIRNAFFPYIVL